MKELLDVYTVKQVAAQTGLFKDLEGKQCTNGQSFAKKR